MIALEELLLALVEEVPLEVGSHDAGIVVAVDELELSVPIESRMGRDGRLLASVPRGQLATGFDAPQGQLAIACARRSA